MKKGSESSSITKNRPALTPEAQENQMIAMATNLAEQRLLDGTASNQIIVHYLKLGSMKAQLENEKLKAENELLKAKTEAIADSKVQEELYLKALDAMKDYSGFKGEM